MIIAIPIIVIWLLIGFLLGRILVVKIIKKEDHISKTERGDLTGLFVASFFVWPLLVCIIVTSKVKDLISGYVNRLIDKNLKD